MARRFLSSWLPLLGSLLRLALAALLTLVAGDRDGPFGQYRARALQLLPPALLPGGSALVDRSQVSIVEVCGLRVTVARRAVDAADASLAGRHRQLWLLTDALLELRQLAGPGPSDWPTGHRLVIASCAETRFEVLRTVLVAARRADHRRVTLRRSAQN